MNAKTIFFKTKKPISKHLYSTVVIFHSFCHQSFFFEWRDFRVEWPWWPLGREIVVEDVGERRWGDNSRGGIWCNRQPRIECDQAFVCVWFRRNLCCDAWCQVIKSPVCKCQHDTCSATALIKSGYSIYEEYRRKIDGPSTAYRVWYAHFHLPLPQQHAIATACGGFSRAQVVAGRPRGQRVINGRYSCCQNFLITSHLIFCSSITLLTGRYCISKETYLVLKETH